MLKALDRQICQRIGNILVYRIAVTSWPFNWLTILITSQGFVYYCTNMTVWMVSRCSFKWITICAQNWRERLMELLQLRHFQNHFAMTRSAPILLCLVYLSRAMRVKSNSTFLSLVILFLCRYAVIESKFREPTFICHCFIECGSDADYLFVYGA